MKREKVQHIHDVVVDRISLTSRINDMVDLLRSHTKPVSFFECFTREGGGAQTRHEMVITFLSILEMARLGMVKILQHTDGGEIYLSGTEALHTVDDAEEAFD